MKRGGLHRNSLCLSCFLSCSRSGFCSVIKVNTVLSFEVKTGIVCTLVSFLLTDYCTKMGHQKFKFLTPLSGVKFKQFLPCMLHDPPLPSKYKMQQFWLFMSVVCGGGGGGGGDAFFFFYIV